MGVINNLIEIRRKFRAIVGVNWDGTTLGRIIEVRPIVKFDNQPTDTSGNTVQIRANIVGYTWTLEKKVDDSWTNVTSGNTASGSIANINLSAILEDSICRIVIYAYGGNRNVGTYSNEFTVTRTAAQTASLKAGSASKGEDIFTDTEVDSVDIVKDEIKKG